MYTNDRKAPRMRKGQFSEQVFTKELWMKFKKDFPEYKKMTWKDFQGYWNDISQTIREEAITNPLGVKLGSYCGELKLQYLKPSFKATDPVLSSQLGENVNHINIVSKGKVAIIKWERRWAVKFNKMLQFFAFNPVRDLNVRAKAHTDANPEQLREARNTLGGMSVWRQIKDKL